MSWKPLEPPPAAAKKSGASARVELLKWGGARLKLALSKDLCERFAGKEKRLNVSLGEGEHDGSVLLEFVKDGKFPLGYSGHGSAIVNVALDGALASQAREREPCVVTPFTASSVIIDLPRATWTAAEARAGMKAAAPAAAPAAAAPAAPAAPPKDKTDKLDMETYLRGKGCSVQRLGSGEFLIDGVTFSPERTLRAVNSRRQDAGLRPLTQADVW